MRDTKVSARIALFFAAAVLAMPAFTQTLTTGDVAGVVKDATGAVVPGAVVTVRSVETNQVRTVKTSASGEYRFSLLQPGDYEIAATSAGLKSSTEKFTALVGQVTPIDLIANVTGTSEVVEVSAQAATLETENANLATGYTSAQVINLPMAGGDLTTLAMTVPGVRVNVTGGSGNMNANGIMGSSILFTLNGHEEMDPYNNLNNSGASNNLLGANEVAEASVILNAYSPEYGRMAGGQVSLVGKSGTNAYHGNAFYNFNGQYLNANDFFNNATATPRGRSDAHQFGASFGGPVKKNKLFFFADYEAMRYVLPAAGAIAAPSPQLEQYTLAHVPAASLPLYQDLFSLVNAAPGINRAIPVTNGNGSLQDGNGALGCSNGGTFVGTPAPGGGKFGVDVPCALAFGTNNTQLNTEGLVTTRADYNITEKQKIYFRYNYDFGLQATGTSPISPTFNSISNQPQDTGSLNYTYVITPTLVNNLTGSAFWYSAIFGVADFNKTTSLMPQSITIADGGCNACVTTPGGSTSGFVAVGAGLPTGRNVGQAELADDLAWTKGRHTIKAGVSYIYTKVTYTSIASSAFKGSYTLNDLTDFASGQVNSTGLGSSFTQAFPKWAAVHFREPASGFYLSDEWAAMKNLKLTLGMRFEHDGNPSCVENCFAAFNVPFILSSYQGGAGVPYNSTIQIGLNKAFYNLPAMVYEPRFGFAWQPFGSGKTVVRGGIGIFSTHPAASIAGTFSNQAPNRFVPSVTFGTVGLATDANSSAAAAIAANGVFQSGFGAGYTLAQIKSALGKIPFGLPSFTSLPNTYNPVEDTEWSFEIQHEFTPHNIASLTYAGNHGYNVQEAVNANMFTGASGVTRYAGGFSGLPTAAPDPRFLTVTQLYTNGISNYDGLTIQFRHVFSYGLTAQIHYTWSHALGDVSTSSTASYYNPLNLSASYGSLGFDNRHQVAADFVWNQQHKFSSHMANSLAGGWTVGSKLYLYSGAPFSVTDSRIPSQVNSAGGVVTPLADVVSAAAFAGDCGRAAVSTACLSKTQFATYASTSGVASPVQTDWGNIAPNSFRGPAYFDIDMQLTRDFRIKEQARFTFGLAGYNVLNHPNFLNPSGSVTSGAFGKITATITPPTSIYGSFQSGTVSGRVLVLTGRFTF